MNKEKIQKIFVAGGTGFLGKRIILRLEKENLLFVTTSQSLGVDFREKDQVFSFFEREKPDVVMNAAAYVGGIQFGLQHEGEIFFNNILMNTYLIEASRIFGVKRFINPISNCSYPDVLEKDFKEKEWWDGPLHPSVFVYGFAKKATWVQSYAYHNQYEMDFVNLLVPNMYGPGDHFDEIRSHALGALIMKIARVKEETLSEVIIWGSGKPIREWLYVDDCVEAFLRCLEISRTREPINIGQGIGISIKEMAEMIAKKIGYSGKLIFDTEKPDGAPYKIMNIDHMKETFHWTPSTSLDEGIQNTVEWYYKNILKKTF